MKVTQVAPPVTNQASNQQSSAQAARERAINMLTGNSPVQNQNSVQAEEINQIQETSGQIDTIEATDETKLLKTL
jgi:hypothetical protein